MKKIFPLMFFIIGIGILFWGLSALKESYDAGSWPTTNGEVISSVVKSYLSHGGRRHPLRRMYSAKVDYQYKVDGQTYTSDKVSIVAYSSSNPRNAQIVVDKYRPNTQVLVYYNPKNPKRAVLEPGEIGGIYIPLLVGSIFTILGLVLLFKKTYGG